MLSDAETTVLDEFDSPDEELRHQRCANGAEGNGAGVDVAVGDGAGADVDVGDGAGGDGAEDDEVRRDEVSNGQIIHNPATIQHQQGRYLRDRSMLRKPLRYEANVADVHMPSSYAEAISGPDARKWIAAINEELKSHDTNGTWEIVQNQKNCKPIDSKWVFKVKEDTEGNIVRYEARLCACKSKGLIIPRFFLLW